MTSENVLALISAMCFGADFEIVVDGGMIQKQLVSRRMTSENVLALIFAMCFGADFEIVVAGGMIQK